MHKFNEIVNRSISSMLNETSNKEVAPHKIDSKIQKCAANLMEIKDNLTTLGLNPDDKLCKQLGRMYEVLLSVVPCASSLNLSLSEDIKMDAEADDSTTDKAVELADKYNKDIQLTKDE